MDTIEATGARGPKLLEQLPERLHHHAFVVRDHEANRRFFEDLLGIPLVATWCEAAHSAELGREIRFCHTFFGLADSAFGSVTVSTPSISFACTLSASICHGRVIVRENRPVPRSRR